MSERVIEAHEEHEAQAGHAHDDAETPEGAHSHSHGYAGDVQKLQNRLRRIEGQVRGIQRLIDEDVYCIDVLTQVSAVKSALDRVALLLLEDHLAHCVAGATEAAGDEGVADGKVGEAVTAIERLLKS